MAARTPAEAVRTFVGAFQSALSYLTVAQFNAEGYRPIDLPFSAELQDGEPVVIAGSSLRLLVVLRYWIIQAANSPGAWAVQLATDDYELLDDLDREILAYQWHPQGRSSVTWLHVHLGPAAGDLWRPLSRAHLPTGRIAVQDVLRLAIRDFGVPPRRADWAAVLERTRRTLEE